MAAYARSVVRGKTPAGEAVRDACARHLRDLERDDVKFDIDRASHVIDFCEHLTVRDGQPFRLQPWQRFVLGSIFGWTRIDQHGDRVRRFRRAYMECGKGSGKSPMLAAVGLYGLVADAEPEPEVYIAAATRDQARVAFRDAVGMVEEAEWMRGEVQPVGGVEPRRLIAISRKGWIEPLSREYKKSGAGRRPHFALIDELHEHPDREMLTQLLRGFKARKQPLMLIATNAGTDLESVCFEEHQYARQVNRGEVEGPAADATFGFIAAVDEDDDPLTDETCWRKSNPMLDAPGMPTTDWLREQVAEANQMPGRANNVLRLHFCVWTDAVSAWMSRAAWSACEDAEVTEEALAGRRAWLGVDLSVNRDLTAIAVVCEDEPDADGFRRYAATARVYIPGEGLDAREKQDNASYSAWARGGWATILEGPKIRFERIAADIVELMARFNVEAVVVDQWQSDALQGKFAEVGMFLPMVAHPQTVNRSQKTTLTMPGSINVIETWILEKRVRIAPSPALRTAVSQVNLYSTAGGLRRFEKSKSYGRIDAAVALTMAAGAAEDSVSQRGAWDDPSFQMSGDTVREKPAA